LNRQPHNREKRKWHRLPLALPVFLRSVGSDGKETLEFATGLNVSAGGILVATRRALPLATQTLLEIPVAPFTLPAKAPKTTRKLEAKIVRIVHGDDFHLIGMRFQRPLTTEPATNRSPKKAMARKRSTTV
jgi:PilZ domain-containing protein